jgi:uncharacterized OB-fold protein
MIKCPNCGRDNADNFNFCLDCGYDLKAYREAFPDGIPVPPPPPPPAMTMPSGQAFSVDAPSTHTPHSVASPLPPLPPRPAAPAQIPSTPPPSFTPAPAPEAPAPASWGAAFPPLPVGVESTVPPPPLTAPSAPTPGPWAQPAPSANTGALSASSMPPPAATAPPAPISVAPTAAPPATVTIPPPAEPVLSSTLTPMASGARPCAACGYENLPTVKFCGNCGKRLDGAAAPAEGDGGVRTMFMHAADLAHVAKEKICKLITIDQSGREGMTFTIKNGETICGRVNGIILFFDDPYVSPTHCKFSFYGGQLKVTDQGSLNGVYVRVKQERELLDGEQIRVGRQLRFRSKRPMATTAASGARQRPRRLVA